MAEFLPPCLDSRYVPVFWERRKARGTRARRGRAEDTGSGEATSSDDSRGEPYSHSKVVQELRRRFDASHEEVVSGTGAGDVEEMPFSVVDILQVRVISDRLDPLLKRNDLIVAGHDSDGAKLQSLRQVHGADRDAPSSRLNMVVQDSELKSSALDGSSCPVDLVGRPNEDADLVRLQAPLSQIGYPIGNSLGFFLNGLGNRYGRLGAVEHRYCT